MFKPRRPEILILVLALYIALVLNLPFWRKVYAAVAPQDLGDYWFLAAMFIAIVLARVYYSASDFAEADYSPGDPHFAACDGRCQLLHE